MHGPLNVKYCHYLIELQQCFFIKHFNSVSICSSCRTYIETVVAYYIRHYALQHHYFNSICSGTSVLAICKFGGCVCGVIDDMKRKLKVK